MLDTFVRFKLDEKGNLTPFSKLDQTKLKLFLNSVPKDTPIETYMTITEGKGITLAQLAKVHAMIKEIADYTKMSFKDIKRYIKEETGLLHPVSTNPYQIEPKSFGDCTIEEGATAIAKCQEIIDELYSKT